MILSLLGKTLLYDSVSSKITVIELLNHDSHHQIQSHNNQPTKNRLITVGLLRMGRPQGLCVQQRADPRELLREDRPGQLRRLGQEVRRGGRRSRQEDEAGSF